MVHPSEKLSFNYHELFFTAGHTTFPAPKILYLEIFASKFLSQGGIEKEQLSEYVKNSSFGGI